MTNEAFARIEMDQPLNDTEWRPTDDLSVRYEYPLDDGGTADCELLDRRGRARAVFEASSTVVNLNAGETRRQSYADGQRSANDARRNGDRNGQVPHHSSIAEAPVRSRFGGPRAVDRGSPRTRHSGRRCPSRIIFRASAPTAPFAPIAGFKTRSASPVSHTDRIIHGSKI